MCSRFRSLFVSKKYSDLSIACRGQVFKVHRAVVCSRSAVLADLVDEGLGVSVALAALPGVLSTAIIVQ